jgi:hypothetical protein
MNLSFKVQWKQLWKSLTIYMSIAIVVPSGFFVAFTWVTKGYDETFRHVSPQMGLLGIPVIIVVFCGAFSLGLALPCRMMSVRITDLHLEGRNCWGIKRRLPLDEISSMTRFDSNGYRAMVVSAGKHGKVYILDQTENVQDILSLLATYLESNEKKAQPSGTDNSEASRLRV